MVLITAQQMGMNMVSKIRELDAAELEVVAGGLDCRTAKFIAMVDLVTATALAGLGGTGNATRAAGFAGHGRGVLDGCGPA